MQKIELVNWKRKDEYKISKQKLKGKKDKNIGKRLGNRSSTFYTGVLKKKNRMGQRQYLMK